MKAILSVIGVAVVISGCSSINTTCQGNEVEGWDCHGNPTSTSSSSTATAGDTQMKVTVQAQYEQKIVIKKDGKKFRTLTGQGVGTIFNDSVPAGSYSAEGYWRDGNGSWKDSDARTSKDGKCSVHAFDDKGPLSEVDFNDIVMTVCPK